MGFIDEIENRRSGFYIKDETSLRVSINKLAEEQKEANRLLNLIYNELTAQRPKETRG